MLPAPPHRTLRHWLGLLMCEKREAAGFKRRHVAQILDVDPITVKRFEDASNDTAHVDQILAAYARILQDADPRDYYREALDRWLSEGQMPCVEDDDDPATRFARGVRREARQQPEHPLSESADPLGGDGADGVP